MHPGSLNRADVEPSALFAQPRPGDRHFIDSPQTEYSTQLKLRIQVHHREQIQGVFTSGSCNIEAETTSKS